MSRLNKTQKYAISWLNHQQWDNEKISNELDISLSQVNSFLEKNQTAANNANIKTTSSVVGNKKQNLMIMETSVKKNNSVAIMTREASQSSDAIKQTKTPGRNNQKNIYKPKGS
jgi:hypothetical protein